MVKKGMSQKLNWLTQTKDHLWHSIMSKNKT